MEELPASTFRMSHNLNICHYHRLVSHRGFVRVRRDIHINLVPQSKTKKKT
jgi:hypothetical protein